MKAANMGTLVPQRNRRVDFATFVTQEEQQNMLRRVVSTPEEAALLTAILVSAVSSNERLRECDPGSVWGAALQGIGEGLIYGREFNIVPFGQKAEFVRGWRGYLALLYATKEVVDADCFPVYEGELVGRNPRTKRKTFDFSVYQTEEEERKHEVIGYYAYVEMLDGRVIYDYMSIDELFRHADRYVSYFSLSKYRRWVRGERPAPNEDWKFGISYEALLRLRETGEGSDKERRAADALGAWYDPASQPAMFRKTVILKLLRSGRLRLANSASKASAAIREAVRYGDAEDVGYLPGAAQETQTPDEAEKAQEEAPPASSDAQPVIDSFFDGGDAP